MLEVALSKGWTWKQRHPNLPLETDIAEDSWEPASVPSNIHLELLKTGRIPDPFKGLNEERVQWIGETEWLYRCRFDAPANFSSFSNAVIAFDGLDTFATVFMNGTKILTSENMFLPYRINAQEHLKDHDNELIILFESAYLKGKEMERKYGQLGCWNGDPSRVYVRKAQYHFGWDWVRLEFYDSRIEEAWAQVVVDESLAAMVKIEVSVEGGRTGQTVKLDLLEPDGASVRSVDIDVVEGVARCSLSVEKPQLWWPVGYGAHPLYTLKTILVDDHGKELHEKQQKLGFRRARLVQKPLLEQPGTCFYFEINNVPIFCSGSNWIPADSFLPRVTEAKYLAWLQLLLDCNQNMVRVWGGGIYEDDIFYNICDENGILVWQDFMFACGRYPAHAHFQRLVKAEAEANVSRLRHHPCIVIFAGNNEDYQYAESNNLEWDPDDTDGDWENTTFPARIIYERLLPDVMERLAPLTPYRFGSPYGGKTTSDQTVGDLHQWNVWHGAQLPYQQYDKLSGRFVSEFGMQGFPDMRTIDEWLDVPNDRYPQSRTMDCHNKAAGFERRIALYMVENFRYSFKMEDFAYGTQLMQAEALSTAYRVWRREWKGKGREYCGGALVWQINDCWPVTSWATVDYYLRPKASYYAIKRELRSVTVGMIRIKRRTPDNSSSGLSGDSSIVELWASNSTLQVHNLTLRISSFELMDGRLLHEESRAVTLESNQSTELGSLVVPEGDQVVVQAQLIRDGSVISRVANWPEPFKYLSFPPNPEVQLTVVGDIIRVSALKPVKGVYLTVESAKDDIQFDDNLLDLVPGDEQLVTAAGLDGKKLTVRWLADWEPLSDRHAHKQWVAVDSTNLNEGSNPPKSCCVS
ncbi:hypothetical protein HK104_007145 [Borealophlyctis nickersoniae]|nr:hypothetical protein HK104_007145 [Borealophlyctis nickersoniae]